MLTLMLQLLVVGLRAARQADREFGELTDPAVDLDRAAMLLGDDIPADREAEPGAFAGGLGRNEGLEQFVPDLRRDAGAVVAHPHFDRVAELARSHLECRPKVRPGAVALPRSCRCWRRRAPGGAHRRSARHTPADHLLGHSATDGLAGALRHSRRTPTRI